MAFKSLATSGIVNFNKYQNALVGNEAFDPSSDFLISETIVANTTTSAVTLNVSGLGSTYKHLQIRVVGKLLDNIGSTGFTMRINGDTGANYATHRLLGSGSSASSSSGTSTTSINIGQMPNGNNDTTRWGASIVDILDAFSTTKNKTVRTLNGQLDYATQVILDSGLWMNTAAITSLVIYPNAPDSGLYFRSGTRISIYGSKG